MILRFTWSPDSEQWGQAARLAAADPDCDVWLRELKSVEDGKDGWGHRHERVVDCGGVELSQVEVERRIRPYVQSYPGVDYYALPLPVSL